VSVADIQHVSDAEGNNVAVIVPIAVWREIEAERETAYLLRSKTMKRRLLEAKERITGISLQDAPLDFGLSGGVAGDLLNTKPEGPRN